MREDARIEALIRELTDFEDRFLMREQWAAIEWAEYVCVPDLEADAGLQRRWSDSTLGA